MTSIALPSRPVSAGPAISWLRAHRREAVGSAALVATVLGGFGMIANPAGSMPRMQTAEERALAAAAMPAVQPMLNRALAPDAAVQLNASTPLTSGPNPAARAFKAPQRGTLAYARALECLTEAVYYEAAREPTDGQRAVAQVVLNRVRHPAFPASVCGVVYQGSQRDTGCQFTFTCDGSLAYAPERSYWDRARKVAAEALSGAVFAPVGNATHYHANYVVPYWAPTLSKSAVIGAHLFYRWAGGWGRPAAFAQRYTGREGDPRALRSASLAAEARDRATPDAPVQLAQAKKDLPPELAKLVESEVGPKGTTRVSMRIVPNQAVEAALKENASKPKAATSSNLSWTLTGADGSASAQKPLGAAPARPESVAQTAAPSATPAGAP